MFTATHLHAMIVHFPIALLLAGFLSEILHLFNRQEFYRWGASFLLFLGTLGAAAAFISGNSAGEGMEAGPLSQAIESHEKIALLTLILSAVALIFRMVTPFLRWGENLKRMLEVAFFALAIGAVSYAGYLGGQLVFRHAAGVELVLPDFSQAESE